MPKLFLIYIFYIFIFLSVLPGEHLRYLAAVFFWWANVVHYFQQLGSCLVAILAKAVAFCHLPFGPMISLVFSLFFTVSLAQGVW